MRSTRRSPSTASTSRSAAASGSRRPRTTATSRISCCAAQRPRCTWRRRLALVADLRKAIDDATLSVAYQPMIDLSRETIVGVEALLRWTHPTQGPIGPDVFIPLAEHSGLIGRVTTYVLEAATEQAHAWREAGLDLTVSVNLSVRDLQRPGLAATVAGTLRAHDVPADRLRLEITEGSVMDQPD